MNQTTTPESCFDIPLYANKPRRRVPGVRAVAVTMYASADGSVKDVTLFTEDGVALLGNVHFQSGSRTRSRGWSIHRFPTFDQAIRDQWPTLAKAAEALADRHGITL